MVDVVRTQADFLSLLQSIPNNYAIQRATVLQSQLARDLIVSLTNLVSGPTHIIINGSNYAATGAGIRQAYADLVAYNGGQGMIEIIPGLPINWGTAEPLNIIASNFTFYSPDSSPILKPATSYVFTPICVNVPAGIAGVVTPVTNGTGPTGSTIIHNAGGVIDTNTMGFAAPTGFAAGDFVKFSMAGGGVPDYEVDGVAWLSRVVANEAPPPYTNTLSIEDSFPQTMQAALMGGGYGIVKMNLLENISITCLVDNNGNTGSSAFLGWTCGVRAQYLTKSYLDVRGINMVSAALWWQECYDMHKVHGWAIGCGQANDFGLYSAYNNRVEDLELIARDSVSGGIGNISCVYKGGILNSQRSQGRNIKNHHVWKSYFDQAIGNYARILGAGGATGIDTSGSSLDVTYGYAEAIGNYSGGLWSGNPALAATNINFISGVALGNNPSGSPGAGDVNPGPGSTSWKFSNITFGTLSDGGTRTSIVGYLRPEAYAAGNFTANNGATITVQQADQIYFNYVMLSPTMMAVKVYLSGVSLSVAAPGIISIALPNGRTSSDGARAVPVITQGGTKLPDALAYIDAGETTIKLLPDLAGGTFTSPAANNLTILFDILIPVNS